jgi:saccharopine dehydrogenase-like NADP-dependent oxidoreductase
LEAIMKRILVLGAGRSAAYLIARLLEDATERDWFLTVADANVALARERVGKHPKAEAIAFDVNDATLRGSQIERADVVISMLPARFQDLLAWDCVNHGKHLVSVSYRGQAVRELDMDARRKGVMLLCEMGLDPGIDHMSAMAVIRKLEGEGGRIVGFCSYGSGLPAPDSTHNPLRYVVTWEPRNVVMAGLEGAQYMEDDQIKIVPFHEVFDHTWSVELDGVGMLEAYANRDSLAYMKQFGLDHVRTMIRGTLRYPGWSETWSQVVRLGLPNETLTIPNLCDRTYAEVTEMFLPGIASASSLEQRVARFLNINPTGKIMENLSWLGLFSDETIGSCRGDTSAAMLIQLLQDKLPLLPDQRDMVALVHEIDVEYPGTNRAPERVTSTLVTEGDAGGFTAMSKTVGLPVLIAVRLLLGGRLPQTGSIIPTHPSIVEPVLDELAREGLQFSEKTEPLHVA